MRTACTCALLAALTAGCSQLSVASELEQARATAQEANRVVITWYLDGELVRGAISVPAGEIPAAARRTADEIVQPGGRTTFEGREFGEGYDGYRFEKEYDGASTRTVTVDAAGTVLARSHSLELEECPVPARTAATGLAGTIVRAHVLQRDDGEEVQTFDFRLKDDAGQLWYAIITATGSILEHGRVYVEGA